MANIPNVAQREEMARDLRNQIEGLGTQEEKDIVFQEVSPGRTPTTLYSTETGEPITIPQYMVKKAIALRLPGGGFRFTGDPGKAPAFQLGEVKCFLHPESPERPLLDEIGIHATCSSAHLANPYSKRMHGLHRHKQEWLAWQEYKDSEKERANNERQDQQLEATLAIARQAGGDPVARCDIGDCAFEGTPKQVRGHKMGAHKEN